MRNVYEGLKREERLEMYLKWPSFRYPNFFLWKDIDFASIHRVLLIDRNGTNLRHLFPKVAKAYCPSLEVEVKTDREAMDEKVKKYDADLIILYPYCFDDVDKLMEEVRSRNYKGPVLVMNVFCVQDCSQLFIQLKIDGVLCVLGGWVDFLKLVANEKKKKAGKSEKHEACFYI